MWMKGKKQPLLMMGVWQKMSKYETIVHHELLKVLKVECPLFFSVFWVCFVCL
jgi:hypothetical protein